MSPESAVVEPRDAASVILARDSAAGLELYFLQRHARMAFAPGVAVFPGGAVDPEDYEGVDGLSGLERWAAALGVDGGRAVAIVRAAVREVQEETGLVIDAEFLHPWACWVTPEDSSRRFRTWFFLARLPAGQDPRDLSGEADAVMWLSPRETLVAGERQELDLWPPQHATCLELYGVSSVEGAIEVAQARARADTWPPARFTTDEEHVADASLRKG